MNGMAGPSFVGTYDFRLVAVSIALAVLASFAALELSSRVAAARSVAARAGWLAGGALAMGSGIWSMHYIGMLALTLPVAVAYHVPTVLLSLGAAVAASAIALFAISGKRPRIALVVAGAVAMGGGIASMHYIGMDAMRLAAMCVYDPLLVGLSVVIAVVVSAAALWLTYMLRDVPRARNTQKAGAAIFMGAAISLMHYCGMAAVRYTPAEMPPSLTRAYDVSPTALLLIVAGTALVLGCAIVLCFIDRRFAERLIELRFKSASLKTSEKKSALRGRRIKALADVARDTDTMSYDRRAQAILDIGTATLRPGRPTLGVLTHLQDGIVVIDFIAEAFVESPATFDAVRAIVYPDNQFVIGGSVHKQIDDAGRTMAWNDLHTAETATTLSVDFGLASLIGTPIRVGSMTHFAIFGWTEPMIEQPFGEDDIAYVDILAAFLSSGYNRKLQSERIRYQTEHDALTGLANRVALRNAMQAAVSGEQPFAFAVLNIDHYRRLNTAYGTAICDELLVEVARMLNDIDERDIVGRRGGDEFAIVLRDVRSQADLALRLERYVRLFRAPFHTGDRNGTRMLSVSASAGCAHHTGSGDTVQALMHRAMVALDVAKQRGGAISLVFNDEMGDAFGERWLDRMELQRALEQEEFTLVYQPTFDIASRAITGAEALIRWNHPSRGVLLPAAFIEFAERNGMIGAITNWVFKRLIADLGNAGAAQRQVRCYMNVAPQQLDDDDFRALVRGLLISQPTLAAKIGFEITETGMMLNVERSIRTLRDFRALGISISIDDFGTGFSSLSYLKRLPVDVVKIDQSFVSGLPHDEKDVALTQTFLQIAASFGFRTLAEGIETEEQLRWLAASGCQSGQGYLISRPIPFSDFSNLLALQTVQLAPASS